MIITVLGPLPPWKGISQYVHGFVDALAKKRSVQVIDFDNMYPKVLYPGGDPKQQTDGLGVERRYDHCPILSWRNPFSRIKAGFSINGSVLHMQYWIWFLAPVYITVGIIARYYKKIPVIITVHNAQAHEKTLWKTMIDSLVYSVAQSFIVHSHDNKQQLQKIIGKKKQITIFPHGIIAPQKEILSQATAREQLSIGKEKKVLLFFGIIRPYKGLKAMLEAFKILVNKDNNYLLIIAGKCREDRQPYQDLIVHYQLENNILRFDGFVDDTTVNKLFCASDLLVLPYTHFDAQSGVVALGLGYEIPMIVSNLGGLTEVLLDKTYIWGSQNPADLATMIDTINLSQAKEDIKIRKKLFSRENIVQNYLSFIEGM